MDGEAFFARLRGRSIFRAEAPLPTPAPKREGSLEEFRVQLLDVGGHYHAAPRAAAAERVCAIVEAVAPRRFVVARSPLAEECGARLERAGWERLAWGAPGGNLRRELDPATLSIVEADLAIAETGTIGLAACPEAPRLLSCLPPHLVVLFSPARLVARLEDVPGWLRARGPLPSALTLVSGPSATGDVDQRLVIGAHGPAHVHVVALT